MSDKDSLFYFMDGLQTWAKTELKRRGVQDLASAIAQAESLIDHDARKEQHKEKPHNGASRNEENDGGEPQSPKIKDHVGKNSYDNKQQAHKPKWQANNSSYASSSKPPRNCYVCDEPHWYKDCPKKRYANAIMAEFWAHQREKEKEPECEERQMGAIQLLNSVQARHDKPKMGGLMYVRANINGHNTRAMVDTGATNNFISPQEATRLGLKVQERAGMMKAVNSDANPILGVVRNVPISMGGWSGKINASVVHMDDHRMVLGMDFFDKAQAVTVPHINAMYIMNGGNTRMVPLERATRDNIEAISSLQCTIQHKKRRPSNKARRGRRDLGGGECHGPHKSQGVSPNIAAQQAQNKDNQVRGTFRKTQEYSSKVRSCPHCARIL